MNVVGGNDEEREGSNIRERVDFVAFADAQTAATEQEERNISTQAGGDLQEAGGIGFLAHELEVAHERGGRVTGASTKATPGRNGFL